MKYSLEKVIDAMEQRQQKEDWDVRHDAIEYLKQYKESKSFQEYGEYLLDKERKELKKALKRTEDYRLMYIHAMANDMDNPELTWEDLLKMKGKPVWLEVKYHNPEATYKYWTIVKYFDSNEGGDMVFTGTGYYYKDLLGVDWQAYRKERS